MPLPKRVIEPVHVARGTLPDDFPLPSELEAVTNGTLANTVRQLSSLSRHAEDMFGELARDAQQLYDRSNSLQARIDRLAIKVTQLDSTVEEVSLQDIQLRKAFKSATIFDQQIFSRATMPTAMLETYQSCDKPPPLDKLNHYRDDGKDGLKFYTDPNYFFELWRQEMLNDTERMMHDRGKKPHRPRNDGGQGNRHKKRVRQPHNTRERQKQKAEGYGEYIMPLNTSYNQPSLLYHYNDGEQQQETPRPPRPNSIEIRNNNSVMNNNMLSRQQQQMQQQQNQQLEMVDGLQSPPPLHQQYDENAMYGQGPMSSESLYQGGTPTRGGAKIRPSQPPPAPPSNTSTPSSSTPTRSRSMNAGREALPPPPPPPEGGAATSPPLHRQLSPPELVQDLPPPPPVPKQASPPKQQSVAVASAPPPPPPPPMPAPITSSPNVSAATGNSGLPLVNGDLAKLITSMSPPKLTPMKDRVIASKLAPPMVDPRNDLLKAIRDGIKLRKVEKIEQKEVERGNGLHDVASILARRVAVEFSDSESGSESECDSEGWGENETSA